MFTGLIQEIGTVERLAEGGSECKLKVRASTIMPGVKIGDSIAVDGVCLTVVNLHGNGFTADVMPETVRRSTMEFFRPGTKVNLEPALRADARLDGHFVSGHVEGLGTIQEIVNEGNAYIYRIKTPWELMPYIVMKGSIAIDGTSLTVMEVADDVFAVSLIPHTRKETSLGFKEVGDKVNLETDILAKYVERLLSFGLPGVNRAGGKSAGNAGFNAGGGSSAGGGSLAGGSLAGGSSAGGGSSLSKAAQDEEEFFKSLMG